MSDLPQWVDYLVNNSVAVGVIIYFAIRDWKFTQQLTETLITIKQLLEKGEKKNAD